MNSNRGALRTQLSLIFSDESLYDSLVVPWKENKELNPLVVRLLSAYFYKSEVRALVDDCDLEDMNEAEARNNESVSEMFQSARETLAMLSIMSSTAQDELANGVDDIMARVNDVASASGGMKSQATDFGVSAPKINLKKLTTAENNQQSEETVNPVNKDDRFESVEKHLEKHDKVLSNIEDVLGKLLSKLDGSSVQVSEQTNSASEITPTQVPLSEPIKSPENKVSEPEVTKETQSVTVTIEEEVKADSVELPVSEDSVNSDKAVETTISESEQPATDKVDGTNTLVTFMNNGIGRKKVLL